jgi:hypothetical protein
MPFDKPTALAVIDILKRYVESAIMIEDMHSSPSALEKIDVLNEIYNHLEDMQNRFKKW